MEAWYALTISQISLALGSFLLTQRRLHRLSAATRSRQLVSPSEFLSLVFLHPSRAPGTPCDIPRDNFLGLQLLVRDPSSVVSLAPINSEADHTNSSFLTVSDQINHSPPCEAPRGVSHPKHATKENGPMRSGPAPSALAGLCR